MTRGILCCYYSPPFFGGRKLLNLVFLRGAMKKLHPGRLTWNLQISHLERKMIWTKPPGNYVQNVNLQGVAAKSSYQTLGVEIFTPKPTSSSSTEPRIHPSSPAPAQVYERKMGVKFIWGEVKELNGASWVWPTRKTPVWGFFSGGAVNTVVAWHGMVFCHPDDTYLGIGCFFSDDPRYDQKWVNWLFDMVWL